MSKRLKVGSLLLVVVVALFAIGSAVYAQGPRGGPGCGMAMGGADHSLIAIAAKTLGIEQTALVAELNAGKTIPDVAKTKDVALDKIVEAFIADHQIMLATAVANGRMTQAQADTRLAIMKANVTTQLNQNFTPNGNGTGFVDADGDGLCDHAGTMMDGGMMNGGMMGGMGNRGGRWANQGQ